MEIPVAPVNKPDVASQVAEACEKHLREGNGRPPVLAFLGTPGMGKTLQLNRAVDVVRSVAAAADRCVASVCAAALPARKEWPPDLLSTARVYVHRLDLAYYNAFSRGGVAACEARSDTDLEQRVRASTAWRVLLAHFCKPSEFSFDMLDSVSKHLPSTWTELEAKTVAECIRHDLEMQNLIKPDTTFDDVCL